MKLNKPLAVALMTAVFLAGMFAWYDGTTSRIFVWVLFLPLQLVEFIAHRMLHISNERYVMFSLSVGIPLTVFYWQLWLRGLRTRIRR